MEVGNKGDSVNSGNRTGPTNVYVVSEYAEGVPIAPLTTPTVMSPIGDAVATLKKALDENGAQKTLKEVVDSVSSYLVLLVRVSVSYQHAILNRVELLSSITFSHRKAAIDLQRTLPKTIRRAFQPNPAIVLCGTFNDPGGEIM